MAAQPVAIIGTGRVGGALAVLWHRAGVCVQAVWSREAQRARAVAERIGNAGAAASTRVEAVSGARWVVLAVPDDALAGVAGDLADGASDWRGRVVLHTSGFHTAAVLAPLADAGAETGSLHPLQAVPSTDAGLERIPGAAFAVDGTPVALDAARELARAAGGTPLEIPASARPLYHASAVLASNALVALLDAAIESLCAAGVPAADARKALLPLVRGTLDNVEALGIGGALTGPVARGDAGTVAGHLAALERMPTPAGRVEPSVREMYVILSRRMLGIRRRTGDLTNDHHRLAKLLLE